MIILEKTKQSRLLIDDGSLVEVICGLGPTIFRDLNVTRFANWLEKHVGDHVPLTRGCS